ncbi:MAG: alpha-L-rhamnosidase, partial [Candidatus Aminicenantes bacterium]|nr:alpha-L-rhamnosidase [Candidatus Aminicenantes bacterium]
QAALYSTYDVCRLLQPGGNAAAVILGNGRHIKNYGYGRPKLFLQLEVDYRDGNRLCLTSGRDWKTSSGPLLENSVYGGQTHDARLEREGWDRPGFDDRLWRPAVPREPSPLASQMMPPVRAVCRLKPRRIQPREGGAVLCDFGQNHSGWTRLSVRGRRGDRIEIRHAELLGEDGGLNTAPNQGAEARDVFILGGGRREILEPRFTYHGFRYAEIRGLRHRLHPDDVSSPVVHSDVRTTGSFHCSHPLLNRLQRNIRWGLLSNLMSIPTDCPQRDERHGWLGDAHLAAETAILNFDMAAFYAKFLDDIRRAQRPDGSLPDFAPPYFKLTYPADPAWASAYAQLAWLLYFYYGDTRVLEIHYPFLKKYMDFLDRFSAGRLPLRLGKYGDWCPPGSVGPKKTPVELTASWYHLHDLRLLQKISRVLGREKDERRFALRAEKTEAAFHKAFLGPEGYAWVKFGPADSVAGQTSQILPLALGIVPPRKKSLVLGKLLGSLTFHHDLHPDTGILGARYLLEVLTEQGHLRDAFRVATRETYPGWGYMIREGATTLWERWENVAGGGMNSHNHIMLGSIGAWLFKTLAGLKCLAPAWERIGFSPPDIPDLDSASARLETMRGTVEARWRREGSSLRLSIRIPPGAKAEVRLPRLWPGGTLRANGNIVWLHGRPTQPAPGLQHAGADKESIRLLAEGGPYDFLLAKTFPSAGR